MSDPARPHRLTALLLALLAAAVVAVAGCGGSDDGGGASGKGGSDGGVFARIPHIVDEVQPATVAVLARLPEGRAEGSGVVYDSDGIVVTNNHVVEDATRVTVTLASGKRVAAKVRATAPREDLAVLEVDRRNLPAAKFEEELPQVGELSVALGNPLGFEDTVTAGIVSGLDRSIPTGGRTPALVGLIQTDAPISPGNSGGALVGPDGSVIGINVAYIPPQARAVSIGFAIPSQRAVRVVKQLLANGKVEEPFLGVRLGQLTPAMAERLHLAAKRGALVVDVESGSPADDAGVQPGDVIVGAADKEVSTVEDLYAALERRSPGDTLALELARGGERRKVEVKLGERPAP